MSGPVSENGVFLNDNERIKKALEEERRILRLQQVRQESKNLSRKLRNDVLAEKERQLRKLQAIKEKESEIWRHAVLKQKYGDYREAIYHIGDAHKNALAENNARKAAIEANKCRPQESLFHRQVRTRKSYDNSARQRAGTTLKRKRHCCCHNQNTCDIQYDCLENQGQYDNDCRDNEVYSCCLSPTSNASDEERQNLDKLKKTAPVLLEVQDGFNFGATQNPSEMKDKFVKNNRQFTHVVRGSPEKRLKSTQAATNKNLAEKNVKKPAEKQFENIKLPRINKVTKLIEELDTERGRSHEEMPTTSAAALAEVQPITTTETESETYNTLTTNQTSNQQPSSYTSAPSTQKEPKIPEEIPVQPKIRAQLAPPTAAARIPAKKPAAKATTSKAPVNIIRARSNQRSSTTVAVRKEKTKSSLNSENLGNPHDENEAGTDDAANEDLPGLQPSGSPAKISREKSPSAHNRSPQRISIHSTADGTISITVDQLGDDSTPAELMETVIEKQVLTSQQKPSSVSTNLEALEREREQACRELKTLSDKLAHLARECTGPVPSKDVANINKNGGGTYRGASEKPTISNVDQRTKVDRASSPTLPVSSQGTEETQNATKIATPATTTTITTTPIKTKSKPAKITNAFKKPVPLPRINFRESVSDKGTKSPTKTQTTPTKTTTPLARTSTNSASQSTAVTPKEAATTSAKQNLNSKESSINNNSSSINNKNTKSKDSSLTSSSYSAVMLDYVADQSKLLQKDLNDELKKNTPNRYKCEKLHLLLERNEQLSKALTEKLESRSSERQTTPRNDEHIKSLISAVCEVRKKREELLNSEVINKIPTTKITATEAAKIQSEEQDDILKKRELELQEKEKALTQQLLELQVQQQQFLKQMQQTIEKPTENSQTLRAVIQHDQSTEEDPVEIVITVKGAKPLRNSRYSNNVENVRTNHVLKITAVNKDSAPSTAKQKPLAHQSTPNQAANLQEKNRSSSLSDNTYESASTQYRSLPQQLHVTGELNVNDNDNDDTLKNIVTPNDEVAGCPCPQTKVSEQSSRTSIHPMLAQYVDRLLSMRRSSVKALGVSMSDIETPSETMLNITSNENRVVDESHAQVSQVEHFIKENYVFIEDLERTLVSQRNMSLDKSMHMVEELWKQYFKKVTSNKQPQQQGKQDTAAAAATTTTRSVEIKDQEQSTAKSNAKTREILEKSHKLKTYEQIVNESISEAIIKLAEANKIDTSKKCERAAAEERTKITTTKAIATTITTKSQEKSNRGKEKQILKSPSKGSTQKGARKSYEQPSTSKAVEISRSTQTTEAANLTKKAVEEVAAKMNKKSKINKPIVVSFDSHESKNEFNDLAKSCSQRISELNSMLDIVREEKQRLLESTYSSVSLSSAEIMAPPPTRTSSMHEVENSKRKSPGKVRPKIPEKKKQKHEKQENVQKEEEETTTSSSMRPLPERNAAIAGSRDSGIGGSRPVTRQEHLPPQASSAAPIREDGEEESTAKHAKPPPTLKRYSPQLHDVESTAAHELSTIVEVETPLTSRLNTQAEDEEHEERHVEKVQPTAVPFPDFEQYLQALQLDLTRLDPELSLQLEEEFDGLIRTLEGCDCRGVPRYKEFPSIAGYLQNITIMDSLATDDLSGHQINEDRVKELIACLRVASGTVLAFPSPREYTKKKCRNSPASDLLDSASLENLSDSDSDTLNIEQELQKRHLLHYSFNTDGKRENLDISVTTRRTTPSSPRKSPKQTKNSSSLEKPNENMGTGNWAATMRRRIQETNALSETSSSPDVKVTSTNLLLAAAKHNYLKNRSTTDSAGDDTIGSFGGRKMNLRDIIQREISRFSHSSTGSSSNNTSTDYSLRQQFFQSILDSMTPQTQPSCGKAQSGSKNTALSSTLNDVSSGIKPGTNSNLARQKTSTPVPGNSTKSTNTQGSQDSVASTLFSCESHISQVAAITDNQRANTKQDIDKKSKRTKP